MQTYIRFIDDQSKDRVSLGDMTTEEVTAFAKLFNWKTVQESLLYYERQTGSAWTGARPPSIFFQPTPDVVAPYLHYGIIDTQLVVPVDGGQRSYSFTVTSLNSTRGRAKWVA
jgi:hypothetical protein